MSKIIFFEVLLLVIIKCEDNIVMLKSNGSTIVGKKIFTVFEENPFVAFYKVPYAEPPVKEKRFKPAKVLRVWTADVTYDFSKPHNETCFTAKTEDCLYLTIYKPLSGKTVYPVLVWIHERSNMHEPDFFVDEDVLVVTVSYRTGILGFLNTGDDFAEGNMGAKDIVTALKWIRENIFLFDGDVNKVTVMGSGNGGNLAAGLVVSPAADDLFTRAIIQSGSALTPADYRRYDVEVLKKLYRRLYSLDRFNRKHLYNILMESSLKQLRRVGEGLFDSTEIRNNQRLMNSFGLTIEDSKHGFLNEHPIEVYKRKMANNVNVIIGFTNLECLYKLKGFIKNRMLLNQLNYNFQYLLPFEAEPDEYGSRRYRKIAKKIMDFYFVNGTIREQSLRRYAKYVSDQVIYPLLRQGRFHSEIPRANVYVYRFKFKGSFNLGGRTINFNNTFATAGDEICYQFRCKSLNYDYLNIKESERKFIVKMVRQLANFVKYGNPTPSPEDDNLGTLQWTPFNPRSKMTGMSFAKNMKIIQLPEEKRVMFWDDLQMEFFPEEDDIIGHDEL